MKKDTNQELMTNWRWWMVVLLFVATTVNYMDRQVLSLTWKEFIAPEFHWTDSQYGIITSVFSIFYAVCMLFAGKFVDWMVRRKDICGLSEYGHSEPAYTPSADGLQCILKAMSP